jgi:hypothetical protein
MLVIVHYIMFKQRSKIDLTQNHEKLVFYFYLL